MWYVVGSSALYQKRFGLNWRAPKDSDIWTSDEECYQAFKGQEGFDVKLIPQHIIDLLELDGIYATPETVYTIKCSHLGWNNPAWDKHKRDILALKHKGCVINQPLFSELVSFWKEELGDKSFLSLNKGKEDFFTDNLTYVYDHDWLHEQVSYPDKPMYTNCLKDGEEVLIDKHRFDNMKFEDQVKMFREEITVIAIERYLVNPQVKGKYSWVQAYNLALKKTITQLTKNWATNFIVLNLEHFVKLDYTMFKHPIEKLKLK